MTAVGRMHLPLAKTGADTRDAAQSVGETAKKPTLRTVTTEPSSLSLRTSGTEISRNFNHSETEATSVFGSIRVPQPAYYFFLNSNYFFLRLMLVPPQAHRTSSLVPRSGCT